MDEFRITKGSFPFPRRNRGDIPDGRQSSSDQANIIADLSGANKLPFYVAADRPGTYLEAMIGESDHSNYELVPAPRSPFPPIPSFTSKATKSPLPPLLKIPASAAKLSPPTETPERAAMGRLGIAYILTGRGII